jgi:hypothetical protein
MCTWLTISVSLEVRSFVICCLNMGHCTRAKDSSFLTLACLINGTDQKQVFFHCDNTGVRLGDFRLSRWPIVDIDSALESFNLVNVGTVTDVSEGQASSILKIKVTLNILIASSSETSTTFSKPTLC